MQWQCSFHDETYCIVIARKLYILNCRLEACSSLMWVMFSVVLSSGSKYCWFKQYLLPEGWTSMPAVTINCRCCSVLAATPCKTALGLMKPVLMIHKAGMTLEQAPENIPEGQACEVNVTVEVSAIPQAFLNGLRNCGLPYQSS